MLFANLVGEKSHYDLLFLYVFQYLITNEIEYPLLIISGF